jgi:hypothetical protein
LKSIEAKQSDPYTWLARTADSYVFTAEIDHQDKERNRFSRLDGIFEKSLPPVSKEDADPAPRIRHAHELFNAVRDANLTKMKCQLLIVKGTKYGNKSGGVRAAVDGHDWTVTHLTGTVETGFQFRLERTS